MTTDILTASSPTARALREQIAWEELQAQKAQVALGSAQEQAQVRRTKVKALNKEIASHVAKYQSVRDAAHCALVEALRLNASLAPAERESQIEHLRYAHLPPLKLSQFDAGGQPVFTSTQAALMEYGL